MHHTHTRKALTLAWVFILILFVLTMPGSAAGAWIAPLAIAALGVPLILMLFPKHRYGPPTVAHYRSPASTDDIRRWENEGGA